MVGTGNETDPARVDGSRGHNITHEMYQQSRHEKVDARDSPSRLRWHGMTMDTQRRKGNRVRCRGMLDQEQGPKEVDTMQN